MTKPHTVVDALMALVDRYWELAYAEGKEGRDHDTESGEAQAVLSEIRATASALSRPSTPQGWKQIGWTCGEGDCGRIHESPGADGSYAVPVYVLCPPTPSDPEWPDVSPEGLRKMAEIAAPNNARVFCAAADVIEALQSRGPRT